MIKLEIDGTPFDNFISLSVTRSMENFSGTFDFTASNADASVFPIKTGSACKITYFNSKSVPTVLLTGWIEVITPSITASSHDVSIQGRDVTCDIIDSTLSQDSVQFSAQPTLVEIIKTVVASIGLKLSVINNAGTIDAFTPSDLVAGEAGQGAFEFLEKQARRRQVLLTTDGLGNIIITRTGTVDSGFMLLNSPNEIENNVLTASATYDMSQRYYKYVCTTQKNITGQNAMPEDSDEGDEDSVSGLIGAPAYDTAIRKTRVLVTLPDSATNDDQLKQMAIWEANIRRARSRTYAATTEGMENPSTGKLFDINQLIQINDSTNGIKAKMLVKQLVYSLDVSGGSSTAFSCVDKDAYSLDLSEPDFKVAVYEDIGDA